MTSIIHHINQKTAAGKKQLAVLIDPDKHPEDESIIDLLLNIKGSEPDYIFVGGSLLLSQQLDHVLKIIRATVDIPLVIFPGSLLQISSRADAILFLSLISGRNPEALIGHHVLAAPAVKKSGIEPIPTGYMLIDGGQPTTASYMSNSSQIPHDKPDIAACTAMAGEMLGLRLIYMDAGSGAKKNISTEMVKQVKHQITVPLIIGGGIRKADTAAKLWEAGADIVVVGNALEKDPSFLKELVQASNSFKSV